MEEKSNNRKTMPIIIAIVVVIIAFGIIWFFKMSSRNNQVSVSPSVIPTYSPTQGVVKQPTESAEETTLGTSPLNTSYEIDNQEVTLVNGKSTQQIPNSSAVITTSNWNTPVNGSLTSDNNPDDASFILVQNSGGSGTFYYVVASLKTSAGYDGTNGILLGDRIAPQNMRITPEKIIEVNFADRAPGAPMTEQPSVGVTKYFKVSGTKLVEISKPQ